MYRWFLGEGASPEAYRWPAQAMFEMNIHGLHGMFDSDELIALVAVTEPDAPPVTVSEELKALNRHYMTSLCYPTYGLPAIKPGSCHEFADQTSRSGRSIPKSRHCIAGKLDNRPYIIAYCYIPARFAGCAPAAPTSASARSEHQGSPPTICARHVALIRPATRVRWRHSPRTRLLTPRHTYAHRYRRRPTVRGGDRTRRLCRPRAPRSDRRGPQSPFGG